MGNLLNFALEYLRGTEKGRSQWSPGSSRIEIAKESSDGITLLSKIAKGSGGGKRLQRTSSLGLWRDHHSRVL